jgi:hypothetical protein
MDALIFSKNFSKEIDGGMPFGFHPSLICLQTVDDS